MTARSAPAGAGTGTPPLTQERILERLRERFGDRVTAVGEHAGQKWAVVPRQHILEALQFLRDDPELCFDFLSDVTIVDHLYLEVDEIPERFAAVYSLTSLERGHRFRLKTPVPEDDPRVPSACRLWEAALWGEREAHDMYGVRFDGNPDLRRLLMPANYPDFPLRKDYPLHGRGERDAYPQFRRGEPAAAGEDPAGEADEG